MIKVIAEKLLGRELTKEDGLDTEIIDLAEDKLGKKIPKTLRDFYLSVGNLNLFMSSFQSFLKPEDLFIEDDKLVFLEENQVVCYWGVNLEVDNPSVFQIQNIDNAIWYSEEILLSSFLEMIMYGQCAEGGYQFSGAIYDMDKKKLLEFTEEIISQSWKKVVDHNHWIVYENERKLIWYYTDDNGALAEGYPLFVSTQTEKDFLEMEKEFGFENLD